jgi:hypothetical protein
LHTLGDDLLGRTRIDVASGIGEHANGVGVKGGPQPQFVRVRSSHMT